MSTTDGEPSFLLDLSKVEHERRLLAWREWMRASFPEFTLGDLPLPAEGGARGIAIGDARLWLLRCPPGRIRRSPDPSSPRNAFVGLMLMGSSTIHREGRHYHLHKDQLCIGRVAPDGAEMSSDEPTVFLLLELPVSWLTARYPQLEALSFHTSSSDQPGVALLRDLLLGAIAVGERLAEHERRVALSAAVELLILPFAGVRPVDPGVLRVERVLATVDQSLGDPRLNAARLARAWHQSAPARRVVCGCLGRTGRGVHLGPALAAGRGVAA